MKHKLSKMLSEYQPHPGRPFYQRMENAPWNMKESKMTNQQVRPACFGWQFAIGFFLVLVILTFSIPPVRASLSGWLGLSVAPSNQMPAPSVTLVAIASPTPAAVILPTTTQTSADPAETALSTQTQPVISTEKPAEISQISPQAGWDILAPSQLPEGYQFRSAFFDTNHQMAILTYLVTRPLPDAADPSLTASKTITLLQAQKNDFIPMQIAPDTHVEDTLVGGQPAVYGMGAWDAEFVQDDDDPNGGKMVSTWRNDLNIQNLYWQVGKVYLVLVTDDEAVSKQELIDMATSIGGS